MKSVLLREISGRGLGVLEDREGGEAEPLWLIAFSFRRRPVRISRLILCFFHVSWNVELEYMDDDGDRVPIARVGEDILRFR